MADILERLTRMSEPSDSGCLTWIGAKDRHGYGHMKVNGRLLRAHRVAYEATVGPIPQGLVIDHLCRNRACVNPDHMEPVTTGENTRRSPWNSPTHCRRGHARTADTTYIDPSGYRACRVCHNEASARYKAKTP